MATILLSCIVNPLVVIAISTMIPMVLYITLWKGFSQKKRLTSAICVFIVCALTNIGICLLIANNPIVICSSEYSEYIDEERKEQIQEDVKSLYKEKGLLFPAIIEVKYADKECLKLHIQYLFFGTVDFSVDADQTKSIDKPLY